MTAYDFYTGGGGWYPFWAPSSVLTDLQYIPCTLHDSYSNVQMLMCRACTNCWTNGFVPSPRSPTASSTRRRPASYLSIPITSLVVPSLTHDIRNHILVNMKHT